MLAETKPFEIKLSYNQEMKALEEHVGRLERLALDWAANHASEDVIKIETLACYAAARIHVYCEGCVSRIHVMLKRQYGAIFASSIRTMHQDFDTLAVAQALTNLLINLQKSLARGTTPKDIQQELDFFKAQYSRKASAIAKPQEKAIDCEDLKERLGTVETHFETLNTVVVSQTILEPIAVSTLDSYEKSPVLPMLAALTQPMLDDLSALTISPARSHLKK